MGKSSKKTATKVEEAPAATMEPLKKGNKRDAEDLLDIQANPKKQKKELIPPLQKEIKAPKKVETSSSDSSDSSDSEKEHKEIPVTKKPDAKKPSLKAKAEGSSSEDESSSDEESAPVKKQPKTVENAKAESSSEDEFSSDEESAPVKKQPATLEKAKAESSSSEDESSSDEESVPVKKQPEAVKKAKPESSSSEDESSSDEEPAPAIKQPEAGKKAKAESSSSEDESSSDEDSTPVKKQPEAVKKAKVESSSSEDESSDEETIPAPKQPVVKNVLNTKTAAKDSSSSEDESEDEKEPATNKLSASAKSKSDSSSDSSGEDSDDEESDDEKPPKKKAKVLSTRTSKQESSSEESDEEESEDEKVTPKKKDSDIEMVDAEKKSNAKQVKTPLQPKTPTTHTQGGSNTLFVGNLPYQKIERSDVENFFKGVGEVVDVRFASHEDGTLKGFGHIEFASSEAAQKALELHGKPFLGRDIRLDLAKDRSAYNTPRSGNAGGNYQSNGSGRGAGSQSKTIFVKGFDSSLDEYEIKSALRDHFSSCGEVSRISIPTDRETGANKGIAYIDLKDGVDKALELSGSEIGGWRIKVDEARPREDNGGGGGGRFSNRGRDNGGRFSNRGRDSGGRFSSRGRDSGGRFSRGRFGPIKPSVIDSAQGKKIVFDDE